MPTSLVYAESSLLATTECKYWCEGEVESFLLLRKVFVIKGTVKITPLRTMVANHHS